MTRGEETRYAPPPVPHFHADLHMHTDYDERRSAWHGERPEVLAQAIVASGIDLFALTHHNQVSSNFFDVRDEVERHLEVERRESGQSREVQAILGMELAVLFQSGRYHMGVLFEQSYDRSRLPEAPKTNSDIRDLEGFRQAYPSVCILNHPTIRNTHPIVTRDFLASGLVDGVEILNGSVFLNERGSEHTRSACELFMDLRERQQEACRDAHGAQRDDVRKIAPIGTSDAHRAYRVGCATTEYLGDHPLDLFKAIRTGQTRAIFRGSTADCNTLRELGVHKIQNYLGWEHRAADWHTDVA